MHRHSARTHVTIGYRYPVGPPSEQDQRAHGAVCFVDTCACGARRETNSNGRHRETTGWEMPETDAASPYSS